ncbi:MAG: proline--tRNA ligase [Candidatus Omnitrophica bacterium]|nr:proline--tRNA ligase [Candidatus Omnitrophota bacterium]MCF7895192.1 proline--tRNA ligase [Candidatus Omnitrophota bacterium]
MFYSKSFINTSREDPKVAECRGHKLLLKANFLYMVSSGIYSYLPLGWRVLDKINKIIRSEMNLVGAQELFMSAVQPIDIWKKTGRDKDLEEVMFKFKDRKSREFCLGPTHEEEITEIVKRYISSYKQLPFVLYQIQTKFRDEPRPRFGLMRSSEFIMKDAYSFSLTQQCLEDNYQKMYKAYQIIFDKFKFNYFISEADPGAMGGSASHEFMVPAEIGEDVLYFCPKCKKYYKEEGKCLVCQCETKSEKVVEVGHIFKLGTKYSKAQGAFVLDQQGRRKPLIMGCYGIGVSRILSAVAETSSDSKGLIWPKTIAPFDATLLVLDKSQTQEALSIEALLEKECFSILIDDRKSPAGVKFNDAYLIGNPYIMIIGKNYRESAKIEVEKRETGQKFEIAKDKIKDFFRDEYNIK